MSATVDPTVVSDLDRRFMAAAVHLARRNLGATGPNPSVGAICVVETPEGPKVVGRGVTAPGGRPHAEPQALEQAGALARGSTLYVTLEPCSHWGRSPPCADAIVAAGVARVVVAVDDPDPRVSGRGYARLRDAGVTVVRGVLGEEARDGLAGFLTRVTLQRPFVLLKLAVSADGMIGRTGVANLPITGPAARARAQLMRVEADAIAIGSRTAVVDDPELTVRLPGLRAASPVRVVFDRSLALSPTSRLALGARDVPVVVVTAFGSTGDRAAALEEVGVRILRVPEAAGSLDVRATLGLLAAEGVNTLMLEGGAALARAFLEACVVDRIALFRSTTVVAEPGLDGSAPPIPAPPALWDAIAAGTGGFRRTSHRWCGADLLEIWDAPPSGRT